MRHVEGSSASPSQASSTWSLSLVLDSIYTWSASLPPPTRFLRSLKRLDSLYGGSSICGLKNKHEIIKLGDLFLREDAESFIESFWYRWRQDGLWHRSPLSNQTTDRSVTEKMLISIHMCDISFCSITRAPNRLLKETFSPGA